VVMLEIADPTDVKSDDQARVLRGRVIVVFVTARAKYRYNAPELGADEVYLANERAYQATFFTAL
jgi:hypothetical protein